MIAEPTHVFWPGLGGGGEPPKPNEKKIEVVDAVAVGTLLMMIGIGVIGVALMLLTLIL